MSSQTSMADKSASFGDESSYNIRLISMEDTQIGPYLLDSPYVFNWNLVNRGRLRDTTATCSHSKLNLSEVEVKRGLIDYSMANVQVGALSDMPPHSSDSSSSDSSAVRQYKIESTSSSGGETSNASSSSVSGIEKDMSAIDINVPRIGHVERSSETFLVPTALPGKLAVPDSNLLAVPSFRSRVPASDSSSPANLSSASSSSSFSVSSASFSISSNSNNKTLTSEPDQAAATVKIKGAEEAKTLAPTEEEEKEQRERARLKRVLKLQKLQQEVRLKALEELARLEQLQSKEMRDIYDASVFSNSSLSNTTTSNFYDSFFRSNLGDNDTSKHQQQQQRSGHLAASNKLLTKASSLDNPKSGGHHKAQSADSFYSSTSANLTCSSANSSGHHQETSGVGRDLFRESFMNELIIKNILVKQQKQMNATKQKSSSSKAKKEASSSSSDNGGQGQPSNKENRAPENENRRVKMTTSVHSPLEDINNKTRVEVFNPKDTTVLHQPKSVRIIRENLATVDTKKRQSLTTLASNGAKIPSNIKPPTKSCYFEIGLSKESLKLNNPSSSSHEFNTIFYSAAAKMTAEKPRASSFSSSSVGGQSTSLSSLMSTVSEVNEIHDQSIAKQGLSYFNSSNNSTINQSVRLQQNNDDWLDSLHEFEPTPTATVVKSEVTKPRPSLLKASDSVDWASSSTSAARKDKSKIKKAAVSVECKTSLQEAFEARQAWFIRRSQRRQHEIQARAQERRMADQLRQELQIETIRRENERKMRESVMRSMENDKWCPRKRQMSLQEIRETTRKNYERLPEVKQRLVQQRLEEERQQNRLKYSIYAKTIQQRLLTSGPNFRLDFKALAD